MDDNEIKNKLIDLINNEIDLINNESKQENVTIEETYIPWEYKKLPKIEKEGVFEHIYKCTNCGLHFKLYSWKEFRHNDDKVYCPECGRRGGMIHNQKTLSTNKDFNKDDFEHEIFGIHGL